MPIIEKTQTSEEINQGNQVGNQKRQDLTDKIKGGDVFKNLDIPTGAGQEEVPEEQPQDQNQEETQDQENESEETEQQSEDAEADDLSDLTTERFPYSVYSTVL